MTQPTTPAPAQEGRQLDAEVAEKIFGLVVERCGEDYRYRNDARAAEYGGTWTSPVPAYSTDISAAFEVAEKVKGEWHYGIRIEHSGCDSELWDCLIFSDGVDGLTGLVSRASGETAALAICLAARDAAEVRSAALSASEADRAAKREA